MGRGTVVRPHAQHGEDPAGDRGTDDGGTRERGALKARWCSAGWVSPGVGSGEALQQRTSA